MVADSVTVAPQLFRVILPVEDIDRAAVFYGRVLGTPGERVSPNRQYFQCGGTILACVQAPTDSRPAPTPNPNQVYYFSAPDLDLIFTRAWQAGCRRIDDAIVVHHWGERAFFAEDPFGNPLCFVDARTVYTGAAD